MSIWREFRDNLSDRDYLRWRRKRRFVRLLLAIISVIVLSPVLIIYQLFQIRSTLGFVFLVGCVLCLLAIYRAFGWIGRPYVPPSRDVTRPP